MPHQRFAPLLCITARLACGALAARADAAPVERTPAASPPVLVAPTAPFGVTLTSPTTASMAGRNADAGLSVDVQVVGGSLDTTTVEFWAELWNWVKAHLLGGNGSSGCTIYVKTVVEIDPKTGKIKSVTQTTIKHCD